MKHLLQSQPQSSFFFFFFNDTATTEIYTLSLHDALPICAATGGAGETEQEIRGQRAVRSRDALPGDDRLIGAAVEAVAETQQTVLGDLQLIEDRRRRTAGRGGCLGDLGARCGSNASRRNRCLF